MPVIPIVCVNCGAKYKLPPTFKGTQAKCPKCSSIIDVAKQLAEAGNGDSAKPAAAAKPAAKARPAKDRSKVGAGARKTAATKTAAAKPPRPARGRGRAKDQSDDADTPRRSRSAKKKDNMPLILSGVGLLLLIALGGFFLMSGGEEKTTDEQANNSAVAQEAPAPESAETPTAPEEPPAEEAAKAETPDAAPASEQSAPSEEQPAEEAPAPKADAVPMPDGPTEPWMRQKRPWETLADAKSAAELYGDVKWPESIDDAEKAAIMSIAEDLDKYGGRPHIRAKGKLVEKGYAGLFGILERLHSIDYRDADDAAFGFELNKMIEQITGGLNARYAAVQAGEDVHPAKAQWNTKTVKAWMSMFAKWPDEAAFKKSKKERAKRNADK